MVWENFQRWRKHPKLNVTLRDFKYALPGFSWGLAAIGVHLVLEFVGIIEKPGHGHHHHGKHHEDKKHH